MHINANTPLAPILPLLLRNPLKFSTELDTIKAERDKCGDEELDGVIEDIVCEIVVQVVKLSFATFSSSRQGMQSFVWPSLVTGESVGVLALLRLCNLLMN